STVDPETLIVKDPDLVITFYGNTSDMGMTYNTFMSDSRFRNLKAVKNNDVYKIDEDIISRDSPRIINAIESVIGMIISWQYNHTPKYCMDDNDCDSKQCNMSIHICMKLDGEKCVLNEECLSGNCENGVCKGKGMEKPRGEAVQKEYCGDGKCTGNETYENCPQDCIICGDGVCDKTENYENCPEDCKKPVDVTWIIAAIVVIILLVAMYLLFIKRRKKKKKE
ncbi:MAG: hypothetical protein ACK4YO_01600, partial [Candidatus Altarchaeaceae archaeon]